MQLKMLTRDDNHSDMFFIGELLFTRFTLFITFMLLEVINVCILV